MDPPRNLRRKMHRKLVDWMGQPYTEALMILGARQIGKTFLIERFLEEECRSSYTLDFVKYPEYAAFFSGDLDVDSVLGRISLYIPDFDPVPGETVLFLDEIQLCPDAITSLKMFVDDGRYRVIASGSHLGLTLAEVRSVPVGRVRVEDMYSLDFDEFLWALGVSDSVTDGIRTAVRERTPLDPVVMNRIDDLFATFMVVGGMPAAVVEYLGSRDFRRVRDVQRDIIAGYRGDIARYTKARDRDKVLACFDSLPAQLAKDSAKFSYKVVDAEFVPSYSTYETSINWMIDAGMVYKCCNVTSPALPLEMFETEDQFKIYIHDTGLLVGMYGPDVARSVLTRDRRVNRGAIAENIVAECMAKCGKPVRYFATKTLEIDFVTAMGMEVAAVEVKSGNNTRAKALRSLKDRYGVRRRILLERTNIYTDADGIEHYPLFAAAYLDEMQPEPELKDRAGQDAVDDLNMAFERVDRRRCIGCGVRGGAAASHASRSPFSSRPRASGRRRGRSNRPSPLSRSLAGSLRTGAGR